MGWEVVVAAGISAVGAGAVSAVQVRRLRGSWRTEVLEDLDILGRLPTNSEVKVELTSHIDASIRRLIEGQNELRRDPAGVVLGIFLLAVGGVGAWEGWRNRADLWGWPLLVAAVLVAALGTFGSARDMTKLRRDDKGRPIKDRPSALEES